MYELTKLNITTDEMDKALSLLRNVQANVRDTFLRRVYADFLIDIGAHDLAAKQQRIADGYDWMTTREPLRLEFDQPEVSIVFHNGHLIHEPARISVWYEWRKVHSEVFLPYPHDLPAKVFGFGGRFVEGSLRKRFRDKEGAFVWLSAKILTAINYGWQPPKLTNSHSQ